VSEPTSEPNNVVIRNTEKHVIKLYYLFIDLQQVEKPKSEPNNVVVKILIRHVIILLIIIILQTYNMYKRAKQCGGQKY